MEKILEKEILMDTKHRVIIELPPNFSNCKVKITVEREAPTETPTISHHPPTIEEVLTWPIQRAIPQKWQGLADISPDIFASMGEDELCDWEDRPL